MKTLLKAHGIMWLNVGLASALTALAQTDAGINSQTTNFGGSRPAGSGIEPSTPNEGGTAWMVTTNRTSESDSPPAVGGTGPGTASSSGRARSVDLNKLGWLGLCGLAGLLGLLARQFESREASVGRGH